MLSHHHYHHLRCLSLILLFLLFWVCFVDFGIEEPSWCSFSMRCQKTELNHLVFSENSFSHKCKCLGWSRGGGVVIAPASRSNKRGLKPEIGKIAGGLRARRGSNPFPGAINMLLDKSPAIGSFGLSEDFFSFKLNQHYIKLKRTTTVETAVLLFFQVLSLNLEVVVDGINFNWTTTSLV